ncbi:MAG TPA: family 1 glycosylhydrolase [Sphingobium sp.]|uniref:family 1 glycosylhydrolase n=1 Tax=Sphingobium sp. TaxID=1912891 RepID=UPI002ED37E85
MDVDRRTLLAAAGATALTASMDTLAHAAAPAGRFPDGFLWGAATAGHQIEGNNVNSDMWLLENVKPTIFTEPSADAANSFELWPRDLDLVKGMGLNAYRFSIEWPRIEPEPGLFSIAMLDHYKAMIEGCRERGIHPVVTFNHYTTPRWFAARGAWTQPDSVDLFARFCDRAARHFAAGIGHATTFNEPNSFNMFAGIFPPEYIQANRAMNAAAARACGSDRFRNPLSPEADEAPLVQATLIKAHKAGRAAIKAARGDLPVGVSLAIVDDQAVGRNSLRDAKRKAFYGDWLEAAQSDDFVGVQNYGRALWSDKGSVPIAGSEGGYATEFYPQSLANAVEYAHSVARVPIIVTEHGVGTDDDMVRARLIPAALTGLQKLVAGGVPVLGYMHWSLIDNFEWINGYKTRFGLHSVDRKTFARTAKPSAATYGAIARKNAV